jgi:hypothetical protein
MNMKIKKTNMDNTMTSIVSLVMIMIGFTNGIIISDILKSTRIYKLQEALDRSVDAMFEKDQQIDELKEQLENEKDLNIELIKKLDYEKQKCSDILKSVQTVVSTYDECLPRLDPPGGPLKRSRRCLESESDIDIEFVPPTSPDPVLSSKD